MKVKSLIEPFSFKFRDVRSLWAQADRASANGNHAKARSIYRYLARSKPKSPEAYLYSGLSEYRLNNKENAAKVLETGIIIYPEVGYFLEHYLRICSELGRADRVIPFVELPHSGGDTTTLWRLADSLLQHQLSDKAETIYRQLASRAPISPESLLHSALSEYRLQNPGRAADLLEAGLNKYPAAEYLFEHYARICTELGQVDRVIRFAAPDAKNKIQACEALFDRFTDWHLQVNFIDYCLASGLVEFAKQKLKFVQENCQDSAPLWRLADSLLQHRHKETAEIIYRQLSKRPPTDAESFLHSALSEYRLQNPDRAADLLEAGLNKYPKAEYLFEHYARICTERGQIDRVIRFAAPDAKNKTQACEALFERFTDWHTQVSLINYCLASGLVEFAEQKLKFVQENCQDSATLWGLADSLLQQQHKEKAEIIYRQLSKRPSTDAKNFLHSALSEYRLQNPDKAADLLEAGLNEYPEAEDLLANYVRICAELRQIERVFRLVAPGAENNMRACETLFDRFADSHIQVTLIDFCLSSGLAELADRKLKFIQDNFQDPVTLWQLADTLSQHDRSDEAAAIYGRLSQCRSENPEEYYFSSLASLRLENAEGCLEILEQGQTRFPEAKNLSTLYIQICAGRLEFERYTRFIKGPNAAAFDLARSMLDFYRAAIHSGAPEAFIINLKELELKCDADDFEHLKDEFISFLYKNPQPIQRARLMVFFSKYLDIDPIFNSKLLKILQDSCKTRDSEREKQSLQVLYDLTLPMIPHYPAAPEQVVRDFILASQSLSRNPVELSEPILDMTNNWTPWQYIFCLAAPQLYGEAMSAFERLAFKTWPRLNFTAPHVREAGIAAASTPRRIRIGFTVHDSMPMMSGLLNQLDRSVFETIFLRPGKAGQSHAAKGWVARAEKTVEYSDVDTYSAIETIAEQELDIIISGPSIAAIFYPMMARLAPLQMVLLEPNWTDGLTNADYYISWQRAEPKNPGDFYKTAVSFFQHPPYWIERPLLETQWPISQESRKETRQRLLGLGTEARLYLCANTPPKIHPEMDEIFFDLLERDKAGILVLLRGEYPPAKSLKLRLREKLGKHYERVVFLPTLGKDDAHLLLQSVDCCLDSYPLCGMSSSFDGAMLGVPIVTLPAEIPFGRWTAAIYEYIGVSGLTAENRQNYIDIAMKLANDEDWRHQLAMEIKEKSSRYVESQASGDEFQDFIMHSWKRKLAGLPPANWISGSWQ
ncbi:tetratricopeptide repeat protein [Cupriavidus sp. AcVe19-1a]|uniref:O-linked N-acetylglucosamine transferase family protein n=1 Tax=Cupriavidus sp. AcVe19-1a TaxID=2821359 RepID=UPI001AE18C29|nr:tetratricopeptide repeat protein [Cupriavidus sp. AcVe19-1a]MBP0628113.1 tetratricopeptide repeat protein [Cupriavidus sp. AcVe19-1a]